jgi:hypothetical protein
LVHSQLEGKLTTIFNKLGGNAGFFVKLSTRSPKDATLTDEKMANMMRDLIKSGPKFSDPKEAEIFDIIAYTRCLGWSLKVLEAKEAMHLLIHRYQSQS